MLKRGEFAHMHLSKVRLPPPFDQHCCWIGSRRFELPLQPQLAKELEATVNALLDLPHINRLDRTYSTSNTNLRQKLDLL
jgi:hypothetical protein